MGWLEQRSYKPHQTIVTLTILDCAILRVERNGFVKALGCLVLASQAPQCNAPVVSGFVQVRLDDDGTVIAGNGILIAP